MVRRGNIWWLLAVALPIAVAVPIVTGRWWTGVLLATFDCQS
jgi:hypothetical protein